MVNDIHTAFDYPYDRARHLIGTMGQGAKIDLFGGEPTLYPQFFDILEDIYQMGCNGSVSSNGRRFADIDFTKTAAEISKGDLFVRTTLHGHDETIHDNVTGVKGSFHELVQGIANIVDAGMPSLVNVVITGENLPYLDTMAGMVVDWHVGAIKFGIMINSEDSIHTVPALSEIQPGLDRALRAARRQGIDVAVEKAPLCLLQDWIHEFSSEREISPWSRSFDDKKCGSCIAHPWCDGLDPVYARHVGTDELQPLTKISPFAVRALPTEFEAEDIRALKLNIFNLPENGFKDSIRLKHAQEIMQKMIDESRKRGARIAFVPFHLVNWEHKQSFQCA